MRIMKVIKSLSQTDLNQEEKITIKVKRKTYTNSNPQ